MEEIERMPDRFDPYGNSLGGESLKQISFANLSRSLWHELSMHNAVLCIYRPNNDSLPPVTAFSQPNPIHPGLYLYIPRAIRRLPAAVFHHSQHPIEQWQTTCLQPSQSPSALTLAASPEARNQATSCRINAFRSVVNTLPTMAWHFRRPAKTSQWPRTPFLFTSAARVLSPTPIHARNERCVQRIRDLAEHGKGAKA
nr:hypothetical protein L204_04414 [Cryptococcus depauperatus CBS 7855]